MEVYCPLVKKERRWSDRIKVVEEPLFRSYVFINCEENQREGAFRSYGAVRYLYWLKKPAIVKDAEISAIRDLLGEFESQELEVMDFEPEDRIRIKSGPLMDKEAIIKDISSNQITLFIESLSLKIVLDPRKNKLSKLQ